MLNDFLSLAAFFVVVFCLQDAFLDISDLPDVITIFLPCILWLLGSYFFEKMSPKSKNFLLNFLILLLTAGFFVSFSDLSKYFGYTAFCALYIFLISALKARNAEKSEKTPLSAKKTKKALAKKETVGSIIAWKILGFIFLGIPYCLLYASQGFMSYSPQFWPLPVVLILSGCVFFMSGNYKYFSFLALALFSLKIDLSGMTGACTESGYCYGHTYVFSPLLIIFWALYLAPGAIHPNTGTIKSKKNPIRKAH